jgi:hypothetical protein
MTNNITKVKYKGQEYEFNFDKTGDYPYIVCDCRRKYFRACKKCGENIFYGLKTDLIRRLSGNCMACRDFSGKNHPMFGRKHSELTKDKLRNYRKGTILSEETKQKIRLKMSGKNHPFFGKKHTKETKEKISKANSGENSACFGRTGELHPFFGKHHTESVKLRISESNSGKRTGIENPAKRKDVRTKIRTSHNKRRESLYCGQSSPNFNVDACNYMDMLNKTHGWNLVHAMNGGEFYIKDLGYWVDGYDKARNIVVEYDEPRHYKNGELKDSDVIRQNEIIAHLNCEFYRYDFSKKILIKITSN